MTYRGRTLIFAYGTLRPGCGNDAMLGNYRHLGTGYVNGYRLHYHECGQYPVIVPADARTYGDILCAGDTYVADVLRMEVLAGYEARWTDVVLYEDDAYGDRTPTTVRDVLIFPWLRPYYGGVIPTGDWHDTSGALVLPRKENA